MRSLLCSLLSLALLAGPALAQAPVAGPPAVRPPVAAPDSATLQSQASRVFLDCQGRSRGCDRDFIVTDVNFVNWMRDRFDADVQVLAVSLTNDADDRIRRELARTIKLGLARYVARSPIASRVQLSYVAPFAGQRQ